MTMDSCIKNSNPFFQIVEEAFELRDDCDHQQNLNVICAKGRFAFNNPGNKRFRRIVNEYLHQYDSANNKREKSKVVTEIIERVRMRGDFIKKDMKTGAFIPIKER